MPPDRIEIAAALRETHLFRSLDDTQFGLVMDALEIGALSPGQVLYREGAPAWHFYVMLAGRVEVTRIRMHKQNLLATLRQGDYFGEEVMRRRSRRPVTVTAVEETSLLRLEAHKLERLCELIPPLRPNLRILASTHQLMQTTHLDWLNPNEVVYLMARKHVFFLWLALCAPFALILLAFLFGIGLSTSIFPGTVTPLILTGLAYLAALAWGLWDIFDWSNDYNIVTSQRVVWVERVSGIYDSRQEAPLTTLLSVGVQTSQAGRIFGYGDVVVRTYTGSMLLRRVGFPRQVASLIEEQWTRSKEISRKAEAEIIQQTIHDRLGIGEPAQEGVPAKTFHEVPAKVQPGWMQEWFATVFHVRFEKEGVITYRKHWAVLLGMVWKPLSIMALACGVGIARLTAVLSLLPMLPLVGACVLSGLAASGWFIYQFLDWDNDIYQITPDQIVDSEKHPLGKEERRAAPLENILSIEYQRLGIFGLLLNYGTVTINVGAAKFTFDYVYNPSAVQQDLFLRMNTRLVAKQDSAAEAERERMSDWITIYHQSMHPEGESSTGPASPPTAS